MSDAFDILGLAPRYDLDIEAAAARHRDLSRVLHPDRHASEPPGVRRQALSSAIAVNEAFRVVSDPVLRAEALLLRLGVKLEEADEKPASPDFLMHVLELREELASAQHRADGPAVERLSQSFDEREATIHTELRLAFGRSSVAPLSPADIDGIGHKLGELRFVRRLRSEAAAILDEL